MSRVSRFCTGGPLSPMKLYCRISQISESLPHVCRSINMNFAARIIFIFTGLLFCLSTICIGQSPPSFSIKHSKISAIGDPLKSRMELTLRRLLSSEPFTMELLLEDVIRQDSYERRFEEWEGDISGRFLSAMSVAASLLNRQYPKLKEAAERILPYQHEEGYFGKNRESEGWNEWGQMMWGHGRLLTGLVEYARLSNDSRSIDAARKLGNYIVHSIPRWNMANIKEAWFTNYANVLESLMKLYTLTGDSRYLEGAKQIVPAIPEFGHYHSHGFILALYGLGLLYQESRDAEYLKKLERVYWQGIRKNGFIVDGSIPEFFPTDNRSEGCSIVDWMRLNLLMWEITDNTCYLDEAERSLYNALFFNQTHNGMFGHPQYSHDGYDEPFHESWWCCIFHGLYGMAEFSHHIATSDDSCLSINYCLPSTSVHQIGKREISVEMKTLYPVAGEVSLLLRLDAPARFPLRIRVPHWTMVESCIINNEKISVVTKNGYFVVSREWRNNDVIEFIIPLKIRFEDKEGNDISRTLSSTDAQREMHFADAAIFFGPQLLVLDRKYSSFRERLSIRDIDDIMMIYMPDPTYSNSPFYMPLISFTIGSDPEKNSLTLSALSEQTGHFPYSETLPYFQPGSEKPISRYPVQFLFDIAMLLHR